MANPQYQRNDDEHGYENRELQALNLKSTDATPLKRLMIRQGKDRRRSNLKKVSLD